MEQDKQKKDLMKKFIALGSELRDTANELEVKHDIEFSTELDFELLKAINMMYSEVGAMRRGW